MPYIKALVLANNNNYNNKEHLIADGFWDFKGSNSFHRKFLDSPAMGAWQSPGLRCGVALATVGVVCKAG